MIAFHKLPRPTGISTSQRCFYNRMTSLFCNLEIAPGMNEQQCNSQRLLVYNGVIQASHSGAYHLLPLGVRSLEKLTKLIDQCMQRIQGQKVALPTMTSEKLWRESGRWDSTGPELFTLSDRHNTGYCLSPTHEESITELVACHRPLSYRRLSLRLYQIGRKFRDEMHPKHGLLRGREFEMKDLYTFDVDIKSAEKTYEEVTDAYNWLFNRLSVPFHRVEGSVGNIGGHSSHEYHIPCSVGEDSLVICQQCGRSCNAELISDGKSYKDVNTFSSCESDSCPSEKYTTSGIEVGHLFLLGRKYSEKFKASYIDADRVERVTEMGCYGIGVTRLLAASVEALSTEKFIRWPRCIAPFSAVVIPQKEGHRSDETYRMAEQLISSMDESEQQDIIMDDRTSQSIGKRIYAANKLGIPHAVIFGKKSLDDHPKAEVMDLYTGETHDFDLPLTREKISSLFKVS